MKNDNLDVQMIFIIHKSAHKTTELTKLNVEKNKPQWGSKILQRDCRYWCLAGQCLHCCALGRMVLHQQGVLGRWRSDARCHASEDEPT